MYNYQRALLEYGMVIINFLDAISEGDGARLLRNWKFLLLYFQHDTGSQKYSLEALYLMFQVYALLSPKAAHNLIWNRFSKRKHSRGGNISLDLALEFLNRIFKGAVKKLGPNANPKSIRRICNAMNVTKKLTETFDNLMALCKRSGKHSHKSAGADLKTLVNELLSQNALKKTPGRSYGFYSGVKPSILHDFDLQKFYGWINDHKKYMNLYKSIFPLICSIDLVYFRNLNLKYFLGSPKFSGTNDSKTFLYLACLQTVVLKGYPSSHCNYSY